MIGQPHLETIKDWGSYDNLQQLVSHSDCLSEECILVDVCPAVGKYEAHFFVWPRVLNSDDCRYIGTGKSTSTYVMRYNIANLKLALRW